MTASVVTGEGEGSDGNYVVVLVAGGGVRLPLSERIKITGFGTDAGPATP